MIFYDDSYEECYLDSSECDSCGWCCPHESEDDWDDEPGDWDIDY